MFQFLPNWRAALSAASFIPIAGLLVSSLSRHSGTGLFDSRPYPPPTKATLQTFLFRTLSGLVGLHQHTPSEPSHKLEIFNFNIRFHVFVSFLRQQQWQEGIARWCTKKTRERK